MKKKKETWEEKFKRTGNVVGSGFAEALFSGEVKMSFDQTNALVNGKVSKAALKREKKTR